MPEHLRAAALLDAFAGLRLGEACGLRLGDVAFMRAVVTPTVQYVCCQLAPWTLERAMRSARKRDPGIPTGFRFHDLRHYDASLLIASGADVKVVQARLRHASAKTPLDTYGHLWPDSDDSTKAAIDSVITARAKPSRTLCGLRRRASTKFPGQSPALL